MVKMQLLVPKCLSVRPLAIPAGGMYCDLISHGVTKTLKSLHTLRIKLYSANSEGQPMCFFRRTSSVNRKIFIRAENVAITLVKSNEAYICTQDRILQTH
jgi:hypothetical protein